MRNVAIAAALLVSAIGYPATSATAPQGSYALPDGLDAGAIKAHWDACRGAKASARMSLCSVRDVPLGRGDAGTEVSARVGDEVVVIVPGAPGSTFYWKATGLRRVEQVGAPVTQEVPKRLVLLRTGQYVTVFRFRATDSGTGQIELSNVKLGAGGGDASEILKYPISILERSS